jgi:hypothetical protein
VKTKPRILLTTRCYRIVHDGSSWTRVEISDGHDRMRVRRWRDIKPEAYASLPEAYASLLESVVNQIGNALLARKRRRKVRP